MSKNYSYANKTGVFVTLCKDGDLRGGIGSLLLDIPQYLNVYQLAKKAAFHDPHFPSVVSADIDI